MVHSFGSFGSGDDGGDDSRDGDSSICEGGRAAASGVRTPSHRPQHFYTGLRPEKVVSNASKGRDVIAPALFFMSSLFYVLFAPEFPRMGFCRKFISLHKNRRI